jgi:seryl-tRNA synthetase
MLDIRYIRKHADEVQAKAAKKGYKVDVARLIKLDDKRRELQQSLEANQAAINAASNQKAPPNEAQRGTLLQIKELIATIQEEVRENNKELFPLISSVPNVFPDDTPEGGEENNREESKWGATDKPDFEVKDHLVWGEERGLIDFERGAKVAGNKFYFLKGALVELELAVFQLGLKMAAEQQFIPFSVPHLVNSRMIEGAGFAARGDEKQIYKVEDEDLNLIATAEIPLTGYHADEILSESELPKLYAGLSPAYRVEGGAYGKHNRGLFRTHQFSKLELYIYCKPEDSEQWHQKMVELEEKFCQALEIPYRKVRIAAGDLGAPAYKKYDIEYWTPVDAAYRELMSCSNVTDYQARRLNIRYKTADGQIGFPHTLNGTLAAMSRLTIAIIENHQNQDGSVNLPKALQPYMGGQTKI